MITVPDALKTYTKMMWNGIAGVLFEIMLAGLFILAGFLVCLFWWVFFR